MLRRFYQACDFVVAPCESAARTMEAQGMHRDVGIWTRGVDPAVFNPSRRDTGWRRKLGFPDDLPVIAFLGRLVREKGLADFAAAVTRLRRENLKFGLLVIGDGPAREEFEQALGDAVFIGYQQGTGLARAIASADILLNPSSTEAFGNVSLEAMASGVPVIAADATGNSNIVIDGMTGALVSPGDVDGYSAALLRYLADPLLRKAHAFNAAAHSQSFTWDRASEGIARIYLAALASQPPPKQG